MDENSTDQPQMTPEEAWKIILLAKQGSEKAFPLFVKSLVDETTHTKIPWSFTDKRFLEKVQELKKALTAEFELQNETKIPQMAEETFSHTLSQEEREGLMQGMDNLREQEKEQRRILSAHGKTAVETYIKQLKQQVVLTEEQESVVQTAVSQAAHLSLEQGDASGLIQNMTSAAESAGIPSQQAISAGADIEIPEKVRVETETAVKTMARLEKITEKTLTSGEDVHAGYFLNLCLSSPDVELEIIFNKAGGEIQAKKLFDLSPEVSQAIEEALDKTVNGVSSRQAAFEQATKSAGRGISEPINDVITALGGPQGKYFLSNVIDAVTSTTTNTVKTRLAVAEGQPATSVQTNPQMEEKIRLMEASVSKRKIERDTTLRTSRQSFSQATVDKAVRLWGPQIESGLLIYLQTASIQASARAPEYLHYFILAGSDIWRTIIGQSTKALAREAIKKVMLQKAAAVGVSTAIKGGAAAIGGPIGAAIGAFLTVAGGKIMAGIRGIISFFSLGWLFGGGSRRAEGDQPKHLNENQLSWLVAFLVIAGIFCCMGMTFVREDASTAALMAELEEKGGEVGRGAPHGNQADTAWNKAVEKAKKNPKKKQVPVNYCDTHKDAPACSPVPCPDCACPIASSTDYRPTVTQWPAEGGTHSGNLANSIDIGAPMQSQVLSPISGTVTQSTDEFADGSGDAGVMDGGGYGNHIEITTDDGDTLVVGHLAYGSVPSLGTKVSAGDPIGRVGETGNTTGPHVHFGFINGDDGTPSVTSLFPLDGNYACPENAE